MTGTRRKRRPAQRSAVAAPARPEPPGGARPTGRPSGADGLLPPWERGPLRGFVRDAVDARGPRLVLLFMPAFAMALITAFGPASDLGRYLLQGSLAALAAVAVDAVLLASSIIGQARAAFPRDQVNALSTGWYVFMRAHRPRSMRRPPPQV